MSERRQLREWKYFNQQQQMAKEERQKEEEWKRQRHRWLWGRWLLPLERVKVRLLMDTGKSFSQISEKTTRAREEVAILHRSSYSLVASSSPCRSTDAHLARVSQVSLSSLWCLKQADRSVTSSSQEFLRLDLVTPFVWLSSCHLSWMTFCQARACKIIQSGAIEWVNNNPW